MHSGWKFPKISHFQFWRKNSKLGMINQISPIFSILILNFRAKNLNLSFIWIFAPKNMNEDLFICERGVWNPDHSMIFPSSSQNKTCSTWEKNSICSQWNFVDEASVAQFSLGYKATKTNYGDAMCDVLRVKIANF